MEERRNREKVLSRALQQALEEDKAPSKALSFNEFGLVCITRKRTKQCARARALPALARIALAPAWSSPSPTLCYENSVRSAQEWPLPITKAQPHDPRES